MLQYLVTLLLTLSTVTSYQSLQPQFPDATPSAASPAQIRFAQENKYDDTGPGAKKPDFAYSTYKTLEEALVAYLDDPDTKLPEFERAKAVQKLLQTHAYQNSAFYPKTRNFSPRPFHQPQQVVHRNPYPSLSTKTYYPAESPIGYIPRDSPFSDKFEKKPEIFKFQKLHTVKGNPISLAHYTRDPEGGKPFEEFNNFPKYAYSYGVHDKSTGDLKQASESREGGNVRGFYSFIDANGKQHTVHYTADDAKGFRAAVGKFPGTT